MVLRQHHVVGLDVPVNHAVRVGVGQRIHHVAQNADGVRDGQFSLPSELRPQRLALDVRQHVEEESVRFARVGSHRRGQVGPEDLDRHLALVLQILGEIDRRHPTATEFVLDGVVVGEGSFQTLKCVGHRTTNIECPTRNVECRRV